MTEHRRTVRRPARANSDLVRTVLDRLARRNAVWAPRFIELDGGDEVLTWLPGGSMSDWWDRPETLDDLARVVRQLHDATTDLAPGHECCVHDDLQPRNVVVDGDRLGLIDWEQLRPGRRVDDASQLCWSFVSGPTTRRVDDVGRRWRRVLDVYGLVNRQDVVAASLAKITTCIDDIVRQSVGGSERHRLAERRGDRHHLEDLHGWIAANQDALLDVVA